MPMGPAPVMSTSSPTRSKERAVWVGVAVGVEDGGDLVGDVVGDPVDVDRREAEQYSAKEPGRLTPTPTVLRQRWRRPARQLRQWPQVRWPSPLTRSPGLKASDLGADPLHHADELVADDHRHRDGLLAPLVPVVDVDVGAADGASCGCGSARRGRRPPARARPDHPDALLRPATSPAPSCGLLGQRITPSARPTRANAAMARSRSSRVWAALIWVRMRACPWGTTGKKKPTT